MIKTSSSSHHLASSATTPLSSSGHSTHHTLWGGHSDTSLYAESVDLARIWDNTIHSTNTTPPTQDNTQPVNLTVIWTGRIAGQHNTLGQHNTANTRQHDYSPSPKGQPLGIIAPAHGIAGFHTTGRNDTGGLASTYQRKIWLQSPQNPGRGSLSISPWNWARPPATKWLCS